MKLKRILLPLLPLLLVLAFIALAVLATRVHRPAQAQEIACVDPVQGCIFTHRGVTAQLRFSSQPTPMQPFEIVLRASDFSRVSAQVQMAGMDMGMNRYDLHAKAPGLFHADITLPVCVSGRRDWKMYLAIDHEHYAIPFRSR